MSIFTKVRGLRPKKNAFNLSHQIAQTQDIGQIMPCYVHDGILPNSRENLFATSVVRFQALLSPLQHKVDLYAHFWYVPYRIIDKKFPKFISGQMERDGETYDCPTIDLCAVARSIWKMLDERHSGTSFIVSDIAKLLFSSSGLLCYLGYPGYGRDQMPDFSTWHDFGNYVVLTRLNVRRLQAYFFIVAQNYINENFTLKYQYTSREEIDLTAELFNFALGDFNLLNTDDTLFLSNVPNCTVYDICLSKILLCLAFGNTDNIINSNFSFPHAWKKDYFTSALPFVQLGEEVTVPIGGGSANVSGASMDIANLQIQNPAVAPVPTSDIPSVGVRIATDGSIIDVKDGGTSVPIEQKIDTIQSQSGLLEMSGRMDLDNIEAGITINELRAANALQSLKEAFARYGTRFQEWLKGFWNQDSSDRSQQLPEWLGGYKVPVQISEIEQTSATASTELESSDSPLGTLAGKGMGIGGKKVFSRHFEEPGVIIGLCFLQPKAVYPTSGIDRFLLKTNNLFDYLTPKMEHLGEQEVYKGELFMSTIPEENKDIFGYQSRYAEYKQIQSKYRGQFADVLSFWHLGRQFADQPVLGRDFIYIDSETMKRPFAVTSVSEESSIIDISNCMLWFNFNVKYIAPMSRFGTPALLN